MGFIVRGSMASPGIHSKVTLFLRGKNTTQYFFDQYTCPKNGDKILDTGCGTGDISDFLPNVDSYGFDSNQSYANMAKARFNNREKFSHRAVSLSPEEHKFDIILAVVIAFFIMCAYAGIMEGEGVISRMQFLTIAGGMAVVMVGGIIIEWRMRRKIERLEERVSPPKGRVGEHGQGPRGNAGHEEKGLWDRIRTKAETVIGVTAGMGCRATVWQLCKYYIVVSVGAAADFLIFTLLVLSISLHYLLANAISYTTVALGVYFFQKNWTFQYRGGKEAWVFTKFTTLLAFTYIMSNIILFVLVGVLLMDPVLSKAVQIVLGALWGYAISKFFVYR